MNQRPNTQQGFTLIETLVVLSILVIIGMIAIPAYDSLMRRYESQMVGSMFKKHSDEPRLSRLCTKKMSSFAQLTPWVCAIDLGSLV